MTSPQTDARPPADVLLTAEIQAVEKQIDRLLVEEQEFRSMMIDRQLQRMKLEELSRSYKAALRLLQFGAMA